MSFTPGDLIYTEEAVVLMDLLKTTSWKFTYERSANRVREDGRGLVTMEDVLAVLDEAMSDAAASARQTAETFAAES